MAAPTDNQKAAGPLQHGLAILDMFTSGDDVVSVGSITRSLGTTKSTASRTAAALAAAGYLAPTDRPGSYRLGPRIAALARLTLADPVETVAERPMTELSAVTGETSHLGVLEDFAARTVRVVDGWHTVRMHTWVGRRTPAHCSAMGKAILADRTDADVAALADAHPMTTPTSDSIASVPDLLADLARIRDRGVALDFGELEAGLWCAAAPVFDRTGSAVASVGLSAPQQRYTRRTFAQAARHVAWAAQQVSAGLGGSRASPPWPAAAPGPPPPLDEAHSR